MDHGEGVPNKICICTIQVSTKIFNSEENKIILIEIVIQFGTARNQ